MHPLVFWVGCLGTRLTIAFLIAVIAIKHVWLNSALMVFSFLVGVGIGTIWLFGLRKTGPEAGGKIWWNSLRPIHALLWTLTAMLMYFGKNTWAARVVVIDVAVAVFARVVYKPWISSR
jgi:hypothetical protein